MPSMQDAIMQMALNAFKNELKNPNSEISKKFNSMLYGNPQTGEGGLFDKFTNGDMLNEQPKRSEAEIQEELNHYKRTPRQAISDNVLSSLGTAARTAGKSINAYDSLLGDALLAVSEGVGSKGFDNPFAMTAALGAGKKARGTVNDTLFSGAGKIVEDIGSDIKNEREKEREAELLLRERPSGQFYDARKQLSKK